MPANSRAYYREYYRKNKERILAYRREYDKSAYQRAQHARREKKRRVKLGEKYREYERQRYKRRPRDMEDFAYYRFRARLKKYGITEQAWVEMLENQGHKCAGCEKTFEYFPNVDHNHKTGKVRGVLCRFCNHALGATFDDPNILLRLAAYVVRTR